MKFKLKDGRIVNLVPLSRKIPVKSLLTYINSFVDEGAYLMHDKKLTYKEEKQWYEDTLKKIKKGQGLQYYLLHKGRVVAGIGAVQDRARARNNIGLGIAISKEFRGIGLGEKLLKFIINKSKKKFKPKNIYLFAFAENKPALNLYKKLGFKIFAKFPKWLKYKNRFMDEIYLIYKP